MIAIQGIEVTQAIQYYRSSQHLTDPTEVQPDNTVQLVSGKPAWVRVYVTSTGPQPVAGVTGQLLVTAPFSAIYTTQPAFTLNAQPPGSVTAQVSPGYVALRASVAATLNFVIPAENMIGLMRLQAQVTEPGVAAPMTLSVDIVVTLQQTLKLRAVMIAYNGPNTATPPAPITIAAPTLADLQSTAAWTLLTYPVQSAAVYEVASTITRTAPLTGTATNGGCTSDWLNLNAAIAQAKIADGNRVGYIYFGLMPANFPNSSNNGGCESSGVSSCFVGGQVAMAHEIGHACGRAHAPCGGVGTSADPNYPAYPPYDSAANKQASIGEYGLNISTGAVPTPSSARDYMSYCGPQWMSLYGMSVLTDNDTLNPVGVGQLDPWWKHYVAYDPWWWLHYQPDPPWFIIDPGPMEEWPIRVIDVIALTGVLENETSVSVTHVARTQVYSTQIDGARTALVAELRDAKGKVLASAPVYNVSAAGSCGCGGGRDGPPGPGLLQAFLPNSAAGSRIVIRSEAKRVWERAAPARPVGVGKLSLSDRGEGVLELTWTTRRARGARPDAWLRYSADKGRSWKTIATGLTEDRARIDAGHLPVGDLLLQVVAHDGFHSAPSEPLAYRNADRVPEPAILHPHPKGPLVAGRTLHLWGSVALQVGQSADRLQFRWTVDGAAAGEGLQVFATVPKPGKHKAELTIRDRETKATRRASVEFTSVADPTRRG